MGKKPRAEHLIDYISVEDAWTVAMRVPPEHRIRLRDIVISNRNTAVRRLGGVRRRGKRDINLYARLPHRVSLSRYILQPKYPNQMAHDFGAPERGQWPPWTVRRYLLYYVLLHELGHLQVVKPTQSDYRRKFARETKAHEFALEWRDRLWSTPFEHPDVVHFAPSADEMACLSHWERLDKAQRYRLVVLALSAPHAELPDLTFLGPTDAAASRFLRRALGQLTEGAD